MSWRLSPSSFTPNGKSSDRQLIEIAQAEDQLEYVLPHVPTTISPNKVR